MRLAWTVVLAACEAEGRDELHQRPFDLATARKSYRTL